MNDRLLIAIGVAATCGVIALLYGTSDSQYAPRGRIILCWLLTGVIGAIGVYALWWPLLLIAGIVFVFLIPLSLRGPRRSNEIFAIGENLGSITLPREIIRIEEEGRGTANILQAVHDEARARPYYDEPPGNFWSLIYPRRMIRGKVHQIRCNFSPPVSWNLPRQLSYKDGEVTVAVMAPTFSLQPETRTIRSDELTRRMSTYFLATPKSRGLHPIRVEVSLGNELIGWREVPISVGSGQEVLATILAIVSLIGGLLGILKALRFL